MQKGKLNVFRASAGSGKTFELTAQYISLLLAHEVALPRGILAVTFTQKATKEMKTRILEHLYDIAHCDPQGVCNDFLKKVMEETGQTAEVLKQRAAAALHTILHAYDDFYVQTIDSFLQRLMRALAHELGLTAGYQVEINDEETLHRAVDRLMQELPQHKPLLDWVTRFAMEHMEETGKWNVVKGVKELATQINKETFAKDSNLLADRLDNKTVQTYQRTLREVRAAAQKELKERAARLQPMIGDGKRFSNGGDIAKYILKILNDEEFSIGARMEGFLTSPEKWLTKAAAKDAKLVDEAKILHPELVALENFRKSQMSVINSCDLSLAQLGELRLLGEIERIATNINDEAGRFMLARAPLLFDRLVGDDDTSFIYERAGVQFRHIMIDEFQDTSTLQWNTFRRLIDESVAGGRGSMLVGDVKQSIYRWRNGDWETLSGIERFFNSEQLHIETLQTNFRSDRRIVAFNNEFFQHAIEHPLFAGNNAPLEQDELRRIYNDVVQKVPSGKAEGFVRVSVGNKKDGWQGFVEVSEELNPILEDLASQIRRLHHENGVPFREMAVLLRKRSSAVEIVRYMALHHAELPLVSAEAFQLDSSPAVQTVVATLRYLLHKKDTAALLYLLHRYHVVARGEQLSWEELIARRDELFPEPLKNEWQELHRLPIYEKCERIIALLDLGAMQGQQDYLFCFLDQVKAFLQSERSDVRLFLQYWDEKMHSVAIAAATVEGVQLLTVHKSKGLAFHTVLMPYVDWPLCEDSSQYKKSLLWCKPDREPFSDMPLLPMEIKKKMADSIYKDAYTREQFRQRVENLNLLYVAFTRAKHNLFVWLDSSEKNTVGKLVCDFVTPDTGQIPFLYTEGSLADFPKSSPTVSADIDSNPLRIVPQLTTLAMTRGSLRAEFKQSMRAQEFLADPNDEEARRQAYIDRGKVLHRIFEHMATLADAPAAVREAVQEGLLSVEEEAETLAFVTECAGEGLPAQWFDGSWTLFRECTILQRAGDGTLLRRRPDRVMERDGQTLVVDFKFGKPSPAHARQVQEYVDLLVRMGKPAVSGFVWYVARQKIVKV